MLRPFPAALMQSYTLWWRSNTGKVLRLDFLRSDGLLQLGPLPASTHPLKAQMRLLLCDKNLLILTLGRLAPKAEG